jgi:hypothetical protein
MFQLDICNTSLYKCVLHVALYVNIESLHSFLIQRCALLWEKSYCVTWLGKKGKGNMLLVLNICWAGCAKQLGWNICIVDYLVGVPLRRQCKATLKPLQLVALVLALARAYFWQQEKSEGQPLLALQVFQL